MSTIAEPSTGLTPRRPVVLRWLGFYMVLASVAGVAAGICWRLVVRLPQWQIHNNGRARITERELAAFFSIDAWFIIIGFVMGLGLGVAAFLWFRRLGWWTTLIASLGATFAGGVSILTGWLLGPGPIEPRIAAATAGDVVPIDFVLSSPSALAFCPFAAMIPLLVLASILPDPEDSHPAVENASAEETAGISDGSAS